MLDNFRVKSRESFRYILYLNLIELYLNMTHSLLVKKRLERSEKVLRKLGVKGAGEGAFLAALKVAEKDSDKSTHSTSNAGNNRPPEKQDFAFA